MRNTEIKTYRLIIKGKVQNVGFRYWFFQEAVNLNLNGYVKNLYNTNEVESFVQGESNKITDIIEKSKKGPKLAKVEKIISKQIKTNTIYNDFLIN